MPLLMSSTFAPMENGDYLLIGQDHGVNQREIARHSTARRGRVRPVQPRPDQGPPGPQAAARRAAAEPVQRRPRGADGAGRARRPVQGAAQGRAPQHRPAADRLRADFLDDYFESDILKGYLASSAIIGTKVGPRSQGSGLVLLYHLLGEHDGEFGAWAFHKGGNGGFTQVLSRAAKALGAEIRLEAPVSHVITDGGRVRGVALEDGTEFDAPVVVSALDPRRTFMELVDPRELPTDLVDAIKRFRFQGTSAKVNFALDGLPGLPGARRPRGPLPGVHEHRAVDRLPRAGVRRGQVRLVLEPAVPRLRDPEHHRPRHGASGQARDVVLRPVRAVPPPRERLGHGEAEPRATPSSGRWSRSSRASRT